MSSLRAPVERRSAVLLALLSQRPRVVAAVVVALLVLSALLPGLAGQLLAVPVLLLAGWLTYLSWPVLPAGGRVLRAAVLVLLVVLVALHR